MTFVHRLIFYLLLLTAFIWACFALDTNPFALLANFEFIESLKFTYIAGFTVVIWPAFYLEVADFIASAAGKNGKLYKGYADTIQKDIVISLVAAVVLGSIYWLDMVDYSFQGIDLAFIGVPFLVHAIYTLGQASKIKVAGKAVKKLPILMMVAAALMFSVLAFMSLLKNSSGEFSALQAIWLQLTILFGSFFIFTNASLQRHFLTTGRFELSNFKKYFFSEVLCSRRGFYADLEAPLKRLAQKTREDKAKHSALLRKNAKTRRKQ